MAESDPGDLSFRVLHDTVLRRLKAGDTEQFATRLKSSLGVEKMSSMVLAPPYRPRASRLPQRSQFRLIVVLADNSPFATS
jgi:hypothetical protein